MTFETRIPCSDSSPSQVGPPHWLQSLGVANQGHAGLCRESVRDEISGIFKCQLCRYRNDLALQWWGKMSPEHSVGRLPLLPLHPGLRTPLPSQPAVSFWSRDGNFTCPLDWPLVPPCLVKCQFRCCREGMFKMVKGCIPAQLCPTLCAPRDCSPPGSSVHGVLQAGTLEWVAMPSSSGALPNPGVGPRSPALQADSFWSELPEDLFK